jgi:hypothetical protein
MLNLEQLIFKIFKLRRKFDYREAFEKEFLRAHFDKLRDNFSPNFKISPHLVALLLSFQVGCRRKWPFSRETRTLRAPKPFNVG